VLIEALNKSSPDCVKPYLQQVSTYLASIRSDSMKRRIIACATLLMIAGPNVWAFQQSKASTNQSADTLLSHLPTDLKLKDDEIQRYKISVDYLQLDTLGNPLGKERVTGEYTRGLPDRKVRWNNVRIAKATTSDQLFPEGVPQTYMEGFTYVLSRRSDMLGKEFFPGFPDSEIKTKNLVWDMHMIEGFGWDHFSKLELNRPYAVQSGPEDVPLAGSGTFQNRRIELTWVGLSKRNDEVCALIQYRTFMNKFTTSMGTLSFQGRSHYWGDIWVSLKDKQIEYATLFEDVLVEFKLPGQASKQYTGILRKGTFEKTGGVGK